MRAGARVACHCIVQEAETGRGDRRKVKKLRKRAVQGLATTIPKGLSHKDAMAALYGPDVRGYVVVPLQR